MCHCDVLQVVSPVGSNKVITIVRSGGDSGMSTTDLSSIRAVVTPQGSTASSLPVQIHMGTEELTSENICIVTSDGIMQQVPVRVLLSYILLCC